MKRELTAHARSLVLGQSIDQSTQSISHSTQSIDQSTQSIDQSTQSIDQSAQNTGQISRAECAIFLANDGTVTKIAGELWISIRDPNLFSDGNFGPSVMSS